jgi:hypothetical protein
MTAIAAATPNSNQYHLPRARPTLGVRRRRLRTSLQGDGYHVRTRNRRVGLSSTTAACRQETLVGALGARGGRAVPVLCLRRADEVHRVAWQSVPVAAVGAAQTEEVLPVVHGLGGRTKRERGIANRVVALATGVFLVAGNDGLEHPGTDRVRVHGGCGTSRSGERN